MVGPQRNCSVFEAASLNTLVMSWLPKNAFGLLMPGRAWPATEAGKSPPLDFTGSIRMSAASGSLLSQTANSTASFTCLLPLGTALLDPPQELAALPPAVHCGRYATAHLPLRFGVFVMSAD